MNHSTEPEQLFFSLFFSCPNQLVIYLCGYAVPQWCQTSPPTRRKSTYPEVLVRWWTGTYLSLFSTLPLLFSGEFICSRHDSAVCNSPQTITIALFFLTLSSLSNGQELVTSTIPFAYLSYLI
ncbi:MAG: hypothetical protein BYD32DRAFT_19471 [Podila humilis]|nr:MAG: hypothetical protein BYD32DRAFT_19471 [Podila humilis]